MTAESILIGSNFKMYQNFIRDISKFLVAILNQNKNGIRVLGSNVLVMEILVASLE